jgi:mannose-6-phosphate isomerase
MRSLYPLTFEPVFKRYLWGGRRLGTALGKPIGEADDYAESWEIADHAQGQSVVANGHLAGTSLHELVSTSGAELLGRNAPRSSFPLIFKFLDCQLDLSVQVHPNDAAAALLTPPDLGKTEAWIVLDAQPGSRVYAGLKHGCDRAALKQALHSGSTAECLHSFEPKIGDCLFIPAGTVHALGAGLLVAEIQQASDTTYRLYDWNRVGPEGKPRPLHVEEAMKAIDYSAVEIGPQKPQAIGNPSVEQLVACDKFILDRWTWSGAQRIGGDDRFHIISVIQGEMAIQASRSDAELTLRRGETALLPASLGGASLHARSQAVALDMYLPS